MTTKPRTYKRTTRPGWGRPAYTITKKVWPDGRVTESVTMND